MKKIYFTFISLLLLSSCGPSKLAKTIENLKAGTIGETTASASYEAFAKKANAEGFENIAKLFEAASKSEAIHAANHKKVLEELGEEMETFTPEFEVKTTAENIQVAIEGENYEVTEMYPLFMTDAINEKVEKATTSFAWALNTEKKHYVFFKNAFAASKNNKEKSLPIHYAVCPLCGNTYENSGAPDKCDFCGTEKEKFIAF